MSFRSYTPAERRQRTGLVLRGAKQALADAVDPRLEARIQRIDDAAEERYGREYDAAHRQLENAKDAVAQAKVAERAADRKSRDAAKKTRREAEQTLQRAQRVARRYQ